MKRRDFLGTLGAGLGAALLPGSLRAAVPPYRRTALPFVICPFPYSTP
jgi:hypothetical protein